MPRSSHDEFVKLLNDQMLMLTEASDRSHPFLFTKEPTQVMSMRELLFSWADFGDELVRFRSQFMSSGDFLCLAGRAGWRVAPNPLSSRKARPLRQSRIGGIAWRTGCLLS